MKRSSPGVAPGFRQGHGFSARARTLLLTHAPAVVERLRAEGVEEMNFFRLLAPEELWNDADDDYTNLWTRRPGFEPAGIAGESVRPRSWTKQPAHATVHGHVEGPPADPHSSVPRFRASEFGL